MTNDYPRGKEWIGRLGLVFFGLGLVVVGRRKFEKEDQLRIGRSGIWNRLWSDDVIPWSEISEIGMWEFRGQKVILLILVDPARFPSTTLQGRIGTAYRRIAL